MPVSNPFSALRNAASAACWPNLTIVLVARHSFFDGLHARGGDAEQTQNQQQNQGDEQHDAALLRSIAKRV